MGFGEQLRKLDALRLQQSAKATVQFNGRLSFTNEAGKIMGLSEDKSLVIFAADNGDLGATISIKGDPEAFVLKKCGPYFYIAFRNYLREAGIDYKKHKIIYDICLLDEKLEGRDLFKFERRILPRDPKDMLTTDPSEDDDEDETQLPADAQKTAATTQENNNLQPSQTNNQE